MFTHVEPDHRRSSPNAGLHAVKSGIEPFVRVTMLLMLTGALVNIVLTPALVNSPFPNLTDDAYINLRYAKNASQGLGFVWNPGERPVEGFTSLAFVLIQTFLFKLRLDPVALIPILGVSSTLAMLFIVWKIGSLLSSRQSLEKLGALLLIAACPAVLFWQTAGFETPVFTLLLAVGAYAFLKYRRREVPGWIVGFLFAILVLTRPEGVALLMVTLGVEVVDRVVRGDRWLDRRSLLMLATFLVLTVPVFAWKWAYFGWPFPNTYYAKTGAGWLQIIMESPTCWEAPCTMSFRLWPFTSS